MARTTEYTRKARQSNQLMISRVEIRVDVPEFRNEADEVGSRTPGGSRATRARFRGRGLAGAQRRPFRKTPFSSAPQAIFFLVEGLETPFPLILGV